jgi:hypothetical protein
VDPECFPSRRQCAFPAPSLEKNGTKLRLQLLDLFTESGLGDIEPAGCAGEITLSGGFEKIFELVKFHWFFR